MPLSVAIITLNEEAKLGKTLESLHGLADEVIVVDSGSTDRTLEIARAHGAQVFSEPWKGYAAQKNSAIAKATGDWVLSLDADESLEPELAEEIRAVIGRTGDDGVRGYFIPRKNFFFGRWIRHGGYYPDPKLRLFRRGAARFQERVVHESMECDGPTGRLRHALLHDAYPTLSGYLEACNKYSTLSAEIAFGKGHRRFNPWNIVVRPGATFVYNYFFRLGFLDGKAGLLLHLYHAGYVSWTYAKAWEMGKKKAT
jgi:glycosyltransferase involved in cell wall biosynthesis